MNTSFPFLTVEQVAAQVGITGARVRQLLAGGGLAGRKFGRHVWLIPSSEVARFKRLPVPNRGRPRGPRIFAKT